jgi:hypothetical protein
MRNLVAFFMLSVAAMACGDAQGPGQKQTIDPSGGSAADAPPTDARPVEKVLASLSAQSDGATLRVNAAFLGPGYLRLGEKDSVEARVDGAAIRMDERVAKGDDARVEIHYVGELAAPKGAPVVSIVFAREGREYVSVVKLAEGFDILDAPSGFRVGDPVKLRLSRNPSFAEETTRAHERPSLAVHAAGACIDPAPGASLYQSSSVTDAGDGVFVWDSSALRVAPGDACEVVVDVRVTTWGRVAAGLGSANGLPTVEGLQRRTFTARVWR